MTKALDNLTKVSTEPPEDRGPQLRFVQRGFNYLKRMFEPDFQRRTREARERETTIAAYQQDYAQYQGVGVDRTRPLPVVVSDPPLSELVRSDEVYSRMAFALTELQAEGFSEPAMQRFAAGLHTGLRRARGDSDGIAAYTSFINAPLATTLHPDYIAGFVFANILTSHTPDDAYTSAIHEHRATDGYSPSRTTRQLRNLQHASSTNNSLLYRALAIAEAQARQLDANIMMRYRDASKTFSQNQGVVIDTYARMHHATGVNLAPTRQGEGVDYHPLSSTFRHRMEVAIPDTARLVAHASSALLQNRESLLVPGRGDDVAKIPELDSALRTTDGANVPSLLRLANAKLLFRPDHEIIGSPLTNLFPELNPDTVGLTPNQAVEALSLRKKAIKMLELVMQENFAVRATTDPENPSEINLNFTDGRSRGESLNITFVRFPDRVTVATILNQGVMKRRYTESLAALHELLGDPVGISLLTRTLVLRQLMTGSDNDDVALDANALAELTAQVTPRSPADHVYDAIGRLIAEIKDGPVARLVAAVGGSLDGHDLVYAEYAAELAKNKGRYRPTPVKVNIT